MIDGLAFLGGERAAGNREIPDLLLGQKSAVTPETLPFVPRSDPVHALLRIGRHGLSPTLQ